MIAVNPLEKKNLTFLGSLPRKIKFFKEGGRLCSNDVNAPRAEGRTGRGEEGEWRKSEKIGEGEFRFPGGSLLGEKGSSRKGAGQVVLQPS